MGVRSFNSLPHFFVEIGKDQFRMVSAPEAFLTGYDLPLIIDEVQMVPELFRALKVVVDQQRLDDKGLP